MKRYNGSNPEKNYYIDSFDLFNDARTQTWYSEGKIRKQKTYHWFTNDGLPHYFVYKTFDAIEKNDEENFSVTLPMNMEGTIINTRNGMFDDPFGSYGFYQRHPKFKGIIPPFESYFKADSLIHFQENAQLYTFDGIEMAYQYEMVYLK